jgi:hypothetical protein
MSLLEGKTATGLLGADTAPAAAGAGSALTHHEVTEIHSEKRSAFLETCKHLIPAALAALARPLPKERLRAEPAEMEDGNENATLEAGIDAETMQVIQDIEVLLKAALTVDPAIAESEGAIKETLTEAIAELPLTASEEEEALRKLLIAEPKVFASKCSHRVLPLIELLWERTDADEAAYKGVLSPCFARCAKHLFGMLSTRRWIGDQESASGIKSLGESASLKFYREALEAARATLVGYGGGLLMGSAIKTALDHGPPSDGMRKLLLWFADHIEPDEGEGDLLSDVRNLDRLHCKDVEDFPFPLAAVAKSGPYGLLTALKYRDVYSVCEFVGEMITAMLKADPKVTGKELRDEDLLKYAKEFAGAFQLSETASVVAAKAAGSTGLIEKLSATTLAWIPELERLVQEGTSADGPEVGRALGTCCQLLFEQLTIEKDGKPSGLSAALIDDLRASRAMHSLGEVIRLSVSAGLIDGDFDLLASYAVDGANDQAVGLLTWFVDGFLGDQCGLTETGGNYPSAIASAAKKGLSDLLSFFQAKGADLRSGAIEAFECSQSECFEKLLGLGLMPSEERKGETLICELLKKLTIYSVDKPKRRHMIRLCLDKEPGVVNLPCGVILNSAISGDDLETVWLLLTAGAQSCFVTEALDASGSLIKCRPTLATALHLWRREKIVVAMAQELLKDWREIYSRGAQEMIGVQLGCLALDWLRCYADGPHALSCSGWIKVNACLEQGFNLLLTADGSKSLFEDEDFLKLVKVPSKLTAAAPLIELALRVQCDVPASLLEHAVQAKCNISPSLLLDRILSSDSEEEALPAFQAILQQHKRDFLDPKYYNNDNNGNEMLATELVWRRWNKTLEALATSDVGGKDITFTTRVGSSNGIGTAIQHAAYLKDSEAVEILLDYTNPNISDVYDGQKEEGKTAFPCLLSLVAKDYLFCSATCLAKITALTLAFKEAPPDTEAVEHFIQLASLWRDGGTSLPPALVANLSQDGVLDKV